MSFRTRGKGRISSLCARADAARWRAAVTAGVLASASVVALGAASAAPQEPDGAVRAAVQAAPKTESARGLWQPPAHRNDGPGAPGPGPGKLDAGFGIEAVSPAQSRSSSYPSYLGGVDVTWRVPTGRDPHDGRDWIEIVDGNGRRVTWDWACRTVHCGANGSTSITANLRRDAAYKALYWSDRSRGAEGRLRAEFAFRT
ncbi:hypothetical protein [Streptomyces lunalinharesii]|uniref:Uncharacterized protein n=1 Tax=Streptomyces lunalinharesii TaxID=333384 RepID=A0ABN3SXU3_9ACTN